MDDAGCIDPTELYVLMITDVYIYIMIYYVILYYIKLYYIILYFIIFYFTILYYIIFYYILLYYIILYCIVLYYIILYFTILYYIILNTYVYHLYVRVVGWMKHLHLSQSMQRMHYNHHIKRKLPCATFGRRDQTGFHKTNLVNQQHQQQKQSQSTTFNAQFHVPIACTDPFWSTQSFEE